MRKEKTITLNDGGQQLTFRIRQFPGTQQERWLNRLVLILTKGVKQVLNGENSENALDGIRNLDFTNKTQLDAFFKKEGIPGVIKILGGLSYEDIEPLYNELMTCVKKVEGSFEQDCTNDVLDACIPEVSVLYNLRLEALRINFDFFFQGGNSQKEEPPAIKMPMPTKM